MRAYRNTSFPQNCKDSRLQIPYTAAKRIGWGIVLVTSRLPPAGARVAIAVCLRLKLSTAIIYCLRKRTAAAARRGLGGKVGKDLHCVVMCAPVRICLHYHTYRTLTYITPDRHRPPYITPDAPRLPYITPDYR
jgi:hypothetical protein